MVDVGDWETKSNQDKMTNMPCTQNSGAVQRHGVTSKIFQITQQLDHDLVKPIGILGDPPFSGTHFHEPYPRAIQHSY